MLRIQAMANGIDRAIQEVARIDQKVERAKSRGIKRTLNSLQTLVRREVSKETGIAQKHLKDYQRLKVRSSIFQSYVMGDFWMGTNPMPAHTAKGRAIQEDWGVKQGAYLFDGAFYRAVFGAQKKIWFRKNSRGAQRNVGYHRKRRSYQSAWQRQNSSRFPVVLAGIDIDQPARVAFKRATPEVMSTFQDRVLREIKYELSKR